MKKILAFLMLIAITVSLIACGTSGEQNNNNNNQPNNSTPNNEEQIKPSAYEQLNYNEKLVFDTLIININDMNNPSAIKVLEVASRSILKDIDNLDELESPRRTYYIRLIVPNATGGTVTKWYEVAFDDFTLNGGFNYKKGDINEASLSYNSTEPALYTEFHNANPSKINAALQEYWKNLGLL